MKKIETKNVNHILIIDNKRKFVMKGEKINKSTFKCNVSIVMFLLLTTLLFSCENSKVKSNITTKEEQINEKQKIIKNSIREETFVKNKDSVIDKLTSSVKADTQDDLYKIATVKDKDGYSNLRELPNAQSKIKGKRVFKKWVFYIEDTGIVVPV